MTEQTTRNITEQSIDKIASLLEEEGRRHSSGWEARLQQEAVDYLTSKMGIPLERAHRDVESYASDYKDRTGTLFTLVCMQRIISSAGLDETLKDQLE